VIRLDPTVHQFIDANAGELLLDHLPVPQQRPLSPRFGWAGGRAAPARGF
jgi:hypothetical protein